MARQELNRKRMYNLIVTTAIIIAAILLYHFREVALVRLRRFDARNRARHEQEARDRRDAKAHYRHTFHLAEEQVEDITEEQVRDERTGMMVTRYIFQAVRYATRQDAQAAHDEAVLALAREFYRDLPAALTARGKDKLH